MCNAANRQEADHLLAQLVSKYALISTELAAWLQTNLSEGLTGFDFPHEHRSRLRTNNCVETLKPRTQTPHPRRDPIIFPARPRHHSADRD